MWGATWQRGGVQWHRASASGSRADTARLFNHSIRRHFFCQAHAHSCALPAPCHQLFTADAMLALVSASAACAAPRRGTASHRAPLRAALPRPAAAAGGALALLQLRAGVASRAPSRAAALGRAHCVAVASTEVACQQQSSCEALARHCAIFAAALNTFLAANFLPVVCAVEPLTLVRAAAAHGAYQSSRRGLADLGGPRSCALHECTRSLTAPAALLLFLRRRPCALRPFAPRASRAGGPPQRPALQLPRSSSSGCVAAAGSGSHAGERNAARMPAKSSMCRAVCLPHADSVQRV